MAVIDTGVGADEAGRWLMSPALVAVTVHVPTVVLESLTGALGLTVHPVAVPSTTV
jgi:hypothetical protein